MVSQVTKSILLPVLLVNISQVVVFKEMWELFLPNFLIIYKMVCKSLSKCESKVENENKMFTTFLISATKNVFLRLEMPRSQGYFKDATTKYLLSVCQHISAFLGESEWAVVLPSTSSQPCSSVKASSQKKRERPQGNGECRNPLGENCPG